MPWRGVKWYCNHTSYRFLRIKTSTSLMSNEQVRSVPTEKADEDDAKGVGVPAVNLVS